MTKRNKKVVQIDEKRAVKDIERLVYAIRMPVVTHGDAWSDSVPEGLKFDITLQRIFYAAREAAKFLEEAPHIECIPYLMTASLQYALDSDWTDIYVHCMPD